MRMTMSGSLKDVVSETGVLKTLRRHFSTGGDYKFDDVIRAQANEICDCIKNCYMMLKFVNSTLICGYSVPTLQD